MTLEEINGEIQKYEEKLKELKKKKLEMKRHSNISDIHDRFFSDVKKVIDKDRAAMPRDEFVIKYYCELPKNKEYRVLNYLSRSGEVTDHFTRAMNSIIWQRWITSSVRSVTKNRCSGINDRNGKCNLSDEELLMLGIGLTEKVDKFICGMGS